MYPGLDFDQNELAAVMRQTYDDIIDFITTSAFQALLEELRDLPPTERPGFVSRILLQPKELAGRGIVPPEGILVQVSAFGDRRPTLFAVKKFLPKKYHGAWENVNWTFDNKSLSPVAPTPDDSWRPPLPVALQNALMAANIDLEAAPVELGVNSRYFAAVAPGGDLKNEADRPGR